MAEIQTGDMAIREYDILIDIITKEVALKNPPTDSKIEFVRSDTRANRINIELQSNGKPYIIGNNNIKIAFSKYDKDIVIMERDIDELYVIDNIIQCTLSPDVLSVIGRQVVAQVIITDSENRTLSSAKLSFYVVKGLLDETKIKAIDSYNVLTNMQIQVENILTDLENNVLPAETRRIQAEELRVLAEQNRVEEFNAKLTEITNAIKLASTNAQLADEQTALAKKATDDINALNTTLTEIENQRKIDFDNMITSADTTKQSLNLIIIEGKSINETLESNILSANNINNILSNDTTGTIKKANDINNTLNNSTSQANQINDVLVENIPVGNKLKDELVNDVKIANDSKVALDGSIDIAITKKNELDNSTSIANTSKTNLDGSITTANNTKTALDESIQTGGSVFNDVGNLKSLRIYKGDIEPTDTIFWLKPNMKGSGL